MHFKSEKCFEKMIFIDTVKFSLHNYNDILHFLLYYLSVNTKYHCSFQSFGNLINENNLSL